MGTSQLFRTYPAQAQSRTCTSARGTATPKCSHFAALYLPSPLPLPFTSGITLYMNRLRALTRV